MKKIIMLLIISILFIFVGCVGDEVKEAKHSISLLDKGLELIKKSDKLSESEAYIGLVLSSDEIQELAKEIGQGDYSEPQAVYEIDGISSAYFELMTLESDVVLSDEIQSIIQERFALSIPSQINARNGAVYVAATAISSVNDVFIYEGLDKETTYVYTYSNGHSAVVTFIPHDEAIVEAYASLVINEDLAGSQSIEEIQSYFETYVMLTDVVVNQLK